MGSCYFCTSVYSNFTRQSKILESLCMVTNLSGFYLVYFLFSCFWGERGEETEKDQVLFSIKEWRRHV